MVFESSLPQKKSKNKKMAELEPPLIRACHTNMLLILFLTHKCSSPTGSCYIFGIDLLKWNDLKIFVAVFLGCTSTGRVGLCFLWFYVQELLKAQPAVVLVLKRLRRRGNGLKSHPTDWEMPGIEPATPGLQDIGLSPTPRKIIAQRSWYICSHASGHFCRLVIISAKGLVSDHDRHNIGHCHLSPVKDISSAS